MNSIAPLTPPTALTRSHEIASVLRDEILRGQYRAGERLPSERDLAARFEASRGAVREALSQIEQLRLIDIQPGGARIQAVNDGSIAVLGPLLSLGDTPDPALVDQFLDTFSALARFTATRAIAQANAEERVELLAQLDDMSEHLQNVEVFQLKMRAFLLSLGRIADNLVVRLISNDLQAQFVERMLMLQPRPRLNTEFLEELVTAMRAGVEIGDGELVASALDGHFLRLRKLISQVLTGR